MEDSQKIASILGVHEVAEDDLKSRHSRVMYGTGNWLIRKPDFMQWKSSLSDRDAQVFWLFGLPASGKTALSSMVAHHLQEKRASCQYHFFSTRHQTKRTAAYCLRTIATQLAQVSHQFREALFSFHAETGIKFTSQDQSFRTIWEKVFEGIIFKIAFSRPLFWVLDGIDEADSQSLLINSLLNIRSTTTIKIFLSSRPMKVPSRHMDQGSPIAVRFLSESDTSEDIRAYVNTSIRDILSASDTIQQDVIDKILAKASGSFLWVRLSLETLRHSWHTQEDIQKALTELPTGMLGLYEQMLVRLLSQPERSGRLAHRILSWVSCSWRPLRLDELQVALEPEFTGFVNLEDTINQICAHFVSVDNGKVSLIHDTARQFLTSKQSTRAAFVQPRHAHSQIAERCLIYLSQDTWSRTFRAISSSDPDAKRGARINRLLLAEEGFPLLGYATCYWAYHVSKSPTSGTSLTSALKVFFSQYCLSWIEAIALSANLRYLTRSARYLKGYAKRKKLSRMQKSESPILDSLTKAPEDDPKWLQSWAIDLIRVVGKFGSILLAKPSSIYQDIVPFCPRNSMFTLTYGEHKPGQLSVTGLPSDGWDDRLARVSVGDDYIASKVLATESYFITLVSSVGVLLVWHTETCEKARKIEVGEYVAVMTLNNNGTLLATASPSHYAVWELSSGRMLSRIDKPPTKRTMDISFAQADAYLVIGSDDCSITIYDLSTSSTVLQHVFEPPSQDYDGCPTVMAINPDATAAAMAWRGKVPLVWHFQATAYQRVRIRRLRSSVTSLAGPEDLRWQIDGNSLFILCQDTNFVEWRLFDEQQHAYPHLKAREFAINSEGSLLLTSDHSGTISVWTFPRLSLIYQLGSVNDFVRDVAFSPDGQRLYDVRDSVCNVWEPDVLVRPDEHDMEDESSLDDLSLVSSEPTMVQIDNTNGVNNFGGAQVAVTGTAKEFSGVYRGKQYHEADFDAVLDRALAAGVEKVMLTGMYASDAQLNLAMARYRPEQVKVTMGVHPYHAVEADEGGEEYYQDLSRSITTTLNDKEHSHLLAAFGELGLDYDKLGEAPKDVQIRVFKRQLDMIVNAGWELPLFLHCRAAFDDFISILEPYMDRLPLRSGLVHSFVGTKEQMQTLVAMGLQVSVNNFAFRDRDSLEMIRHLPLPNLQIETDAPWGDIQASSEVAKAYLKNASKWPWGNKKKDKFTRGDMVKERNESCNMEKVALVVAGIKGIGVEEVAACAWSNSMTMFFARG
ncbi:unnamed protein product [Alternaria alternata]